MISTKDFPYDAVRVKLPYPWGDGHMEVPVYEGLPYPLWGHHDPCITCTY